MKQAYTPKKRNTRSRLRKSIVLIAAEGNNKTERLYFSKFNSQSVNIKFARGNYTDPVNLANSLVKEYKDMELDPSLGDSIFCVVDEDLSPKQESLIKEAKRPLLKKHGFMIVSNPCFEVWFLCHYSYSTKQYASSQDVVKTLTGLLPDYSKSAENMFEILEDKMDQAISNAKLLEEKHKAVGNSLESYKCQPRTDVYKIVEKLRAMNKKE